LFLRSKVDIDFKYFGFLFFRFFAGEFSLAAWVVITFWFLKDLAFAALSYYADHKGGGVAFGAHVGGFLLGAGILGTYKLLPAKKAPPKAAPMRVKLPARAGQPDPADAPTAEPNVYIYSGENQFGPFNRFQIRPMVGEGSVRPDAQYWSEGMKE